MFNAKTLLLFALLHEIFVSRQSDYETFNKWCYASTSSTQERGGREIIRMSHVV